MRKAGPGNHRQDCPRAESRMRALGPAIGTAAVKALLAMPKNAATTPLTPICSHRRPGPSVAGLGPRRGLVRRSCPARFRLASDDNWIVKIGSLNLQHCQFERHRRAKGEPKGNGHAAAVAVSHLLIASARELRRVRRDTRYSFIGGNWGVFAIEFIGQATPDRAGARPIYHLQRGKPK
jgi:hypothetical protein